MITKEFIHRLIAKLNLSHIDRQNILLDYQSKNYHNELDSLGFLSNSSSANQLYRIPTAFKKADIRLLISADRFFHTKYDPVILREYYDTLSSLGYLLVITEKNQHINLFKDFSDKFKLVNNIQVCLNKNLFCLCFQKKIDLNLTNQDNISKWTFGYITNGTKNDFINNQIQRIKNLGLEEWEIIICGKYNLFGSTDNHIKYLPFSENDDKGWITKKKNLICENAKYENLVILHDRYIIPLNFLEKMKEWGNDFDLLGARQIYYPSHLDSTPVRCQDWMTYGKELEIGRKDRSADDVGILEPHDWDKWCYITGGLYIVKRSLMLKIPQDESLFWNELEDIKFCHDFTKAGYLIRFNPYLEFESVSYRWPALVVQYKLDTKQLGLKKTSRETLMYWYFYLIDYLVIAKEIKSSLEKLGNDFLQKAKFTIGRSEDLSIAESKLSAIQNIRDLNNWCTDVLNTGSISQQIENLDKISQIHLAFNLILARRPSPYEEIFWENKKQMFTKTISDLLRETEFQYRIRTLARTTHEITKKDILVLKLLSFIKPIIILIIMILIDSTRSNSQRLSFIKKLIKKIMFCIS
ncbi:MAG: hypothetical protein LH649_08515 [Pseudanabaena sp. CAN_BIN31]|nr:hypothetical protein [Pseudanabaena sp. CAN_BIN31]